MNENVKVLLPKLGESILSATIVRWFKHIGDPIKLDEPLLEVATDKVNSEIPSPVAGILKEIHAEPEQELQVGALIAVIQAGAKSAEISISQGSSIPSNVPTSNEDMKQFYSPALLRIARENGISIDQLQSIPGTGMGGRVTKNDLEEYVASKTAKPCPMATKPTSHIERLKMSGVRKAIADNMVRSFYEAPHATLVIEVDVTSMIKAIHKEKESFLQKHGFKLTITPFVAKAIAQALQEYPLLNSSLEGETILVKRFVNLGVAVSVEQGLMVPVVKHCQLMGVTALAEAIGTLSAKARQSKLAPDDVAEGTITLTNFGMSGVQIGVPIIRYPEVAIIGVGAIVKESRSFGK